jgi:hypothetical protein
VRQAAAGRKGRLKVALSKWYCRRALSGRSHHGMVGPACSANAPFDALRTVEQEGCMIRT